MKTFEFFEPKTLTEVLKMFDRYGERARLLAGGTDLVVQMKQKSIAPDYVVSPRFIPDFDLLVWDEARGLEISPLVTYASLLGSNEIQEKYPIIVDACLAVGTPQIRNRGTIVGNVCNANPAADTIPSLIVLNSAIQLRSVNGERIVPVEQFLKAPNKTAASSSELVTSILIPPPRANSGGAYFWLPKATRVDETLVGCAALITINADSLIFEDAKIALGAVGPTPFRARKTENFLLGKSGSDEVLAEAGEIASNESSPIGRFNISGAYRKKMVKVLLKRSIKKALERLS